MIGPLPQTPREVLRQIDHYEWIKARFPGLYADEVKLIEQRERAR